MAQTPAGAPFDRKINAEANQLTMRQLRSQHVQNRTNQNQDIETAEVEIKFEPKNMVEDLIVRYSVDDHQDFNDREIISSTIKKKLKPPVPRFSQIIDDKNKIISKQYDATNIGSFIAELGDSIKTEESKRKFNHLVLEK